jgi:hypothetical protein
MTRRSSYLTLALLAAIVTAGPSAATNLNDFAKCLTRAGATYYTAEWCPHCQRQNAMFGSALRYVHAVDCTNGCSDVSSFPMWIFRDGSRHPGVASFDELARKTQCAFGRSDGDDGGWRRPERQAPPDDDRDDDQREAAGTGTTERVVGGAKIIEVPRR